MKLLNYRLGFATNSSSSHSILLLPPGEVEKIEGRSNYDGYGWEDFTLVGKGEKATYLATQIAESLGYDSWEKNEETLAKNVAIRRKIEDLIGTDLFGEISYIDHQSRWVLPKDWRNPEDLDRAFIQRLTEWVFEKNTVILGGNDNSDGHYLIYDRYDNPEDHGEYKGYERRYPVRDYGGINLVARDEGDYWTFFNRNTGEKTRFSFTDEEFDPRPLTPELVDIKITDYCPFGCSFCYQDSTPHGRHANAEMIVNVAEMLAQAEVFEVALGGGEPTMHPDFLWVLEEFRERGVVPNFTTRSLHWLKDTERAKQIMATAGAFAYSAHSAEDIEKLAEATADVKQGRMYGYHPIVVHVVMGTVDRNTLLAMFNAARGAQFEVTLLGWKRVGRAQEPDHPYLDWWLPTVKESSLHRVGIDTTLAAESDAAKVLDEFPKWMYHIEDGKFSAYIDAVAGTCAPSSWEPERGTWPVRELVTAFQSRWGLDEWDTPENYQ